MTVRLVGKVKAAVLAAGVAPSFEYTAGEDLPANAPVCKGEDNGKIYLTQATSWDRMPLFGATLKAANKDDTVAVIQAGIVRNVPRDADFNYDDTIYVSKNLGKFTKTPPED